MLDEIQIERVYDYRKRIRASGEYVVLVDRLWPRGVSKASLDIDEHLPDLGPSHELRKWFAHQDERWDLFRDKYHLELASNKVATQTLMRLKSIVAIQPLRLLFSARNEKHNQARALMEYLMAMK